MEQSDAPNTPPAAPAAPAETITALEKIKVPEVVDFEVIRSTIGPSIDLALSKAAKIATNIKDVASRDIAIDAVEKLKEDCKIPLERWRLKEYEQTYRIPGEKVRAEFDPRLKQIDAITKTILGYVSDFNVKKARLEAEAKERAEADARRAREEMERKQRELEEAERRRAQAIEDEKRRKKEAEEAEERRIVAEKELKDRLERESREAAAAETKRKLDEEEKARISHAEVAHAEGNGPNKVDTILESPTPISPVLAKPERTKTDEDLRLEKEQAERVALERAKNEAHEAAIAEENRRVAEADAEQKRRELSEAATAHSAAAAAAATTGLALKSESRTTSVVRWVWDLDSDGTAQGDREAVMSLLRAIVAGYVPLEFMGYDNEHPEDFRPAIIGTYVTEKKERFKCPGIKAYPQNEERLKRRNVGGRR